MRALFLFVFVFSFADSPNARAASSTLHEILNETIHASVEAMNRCEISEEMTSPSASLWFFRRFSVRVRPKFSFSIPAIAKVEIVPEIELLWQRELPTGWIVFRR